MGNMMKLLIAIGENRGENSKFSEHFEHCPYFAMYKTNSKKLEFVRNELKPTNPNVSPVDQIMRFKPYIVFSLGMGQRAIRLLNEKLVKLKTCNYNNVKEVIENINNLKELNEEWGH
jgi:predicted Fe-Mo cluster-binding NifX family protein